VHMNAGHPIYYCTMTSRSQCVKKLAWALVIVLLILLVSEIPVFLWFYGSV